MENLPHVPSGKQNVSAKRLISSKCLISRRQMLIPPTQNICQASLPILKPMSLLLRVCLGSHCFTLFDHKDTYTSLCAEGKAIGYFHFNRQIGDLSRGRIKKVEVCLS